MGGSQMSLWWHPGVPPRETSESRHTMTRSHLQLDDRERFARVVLAAVLAVIVYRTGFSSGMPDVVLAVAATVVGLLAVMTGASGMCLNRAGSAQRGSLGYLALRLFVGWEFLYAGYEKLFVGPGWVGSGHGAALKGFLSGVAPKAAGDHASVPGWFASLTQHVFVPNAELISYFIVFGEIAVGLGLIIGLFTRTAALFAALMNMAFLLAGSTGAGKNPEMLVAELVLIMGSVAVYALSVDYFIRGRMRVHRDGHRLSITRDQLAVPAKVALAPRATS